MIVVSDTSPLNYLVLIGADHVLPSLFGQVMAPPEVLVDGRIAAHRRCSTNHRLTSWLRPLVRCDVLALLCIAPTYRGDAEG